MNLSRQHQWQDILQITAQLQQLSVNENLSAMAELGIQRQEKLDVFFSVEVASTDAEEIAQGIRKIMESDALLTQKSVHQQQSILEGVKTLVTGKQAVKAYGDIQKN